MDGIETRALGRRRWSGYETRRADGEGMLWTVEDGWGILIDSERREGHAQRPTGGAAISIMDMVEHMSSHEGLHIQAFNRLTYQESAVTL